MPLDLFAQAVRSVAPLTRVVSLHLMGDPLVHPQLDRMVGLCADAGLQIALVTNGLLLRDKEAALLLHPAFRQVSFSLHSFADNFGQKDPGPYLERIFRFTEAAFEKRPELFINYRLWNLQGPAHTRASNAAILQRIEERFGLGEAAEVAAGVNPRERRNYVVKNYLSLHFETEFVWPALTLPVLGETGTCYGLKSHFGVLVDGTVVPCCLDKEGDIPLGNLAERPLAEILQSPRARALFEGFRQGKLAEPLCQRCQYIERFAPSSRPLPEPDLRLSTKGVQCRPTEEALC